jgi:hypothetical protein
MADVVSQLQTEGYNINAVSSDGNTITGISLNTNSLSIPKDENTAEIEVSYLGGTEGYTYYAVVKGNYYVMSQENGKIQIARKASDGVGENSSVDTLTIVSSNSLFTAVINGNKITITSGSNTGNENLEIKYGNYTQTCAISIVEATIDAATVSKNATTYYGALVENYNVPYDDTEGATNAWRIFYSDSTNIYLIADDYIHYDYAPESTNNTIYKNSNYRLSFNNVYKDYTGINIIIAGKWLSSYWKNNSERENTNTNIRVVAYMLDTSIWNKRFRNSKYADYAIGGPTIEMYCASYKDTHPSKYIECEAESNTNGYNVKWSSDSTYSTYISGLATSNDYNGIYIKYDVTKAWAMWLASPSANNANHAMSAAYVGSVGYDAYDSPYPGLRPIVCLSSDIQLEKLDNGNYRIVKSTE